MYIQITTDRLLNLCEQYSFGFCCVDHKIIYSIPYEDILKNIIGCIYKIMQIMAIEKYFSVICKSC